MAFRNAGLPVMRRQLSICFSDVLGMHQFGDECCCVCVENHTELQWNACEMSPTKCQHPCNLQSEGFVMARGFAAFCCHVMLKQCEITQVFCSIIIAKLIAQPGEHNPSCQQDKKTEID